MKQVGTDIPKVDALEKVLGSARYGADQSIDRPLQMFTGKIGLESLKRINPS
jgi:CO/xanthine dehydrogenase Mo-binding subunit